MGQHAITTRQNEAHISAEDMSVIWSTILGDGRQITSGIEPSVPSATTLHVSKGEALIDGRWYFVTDNGLDLTIPSGTLNMDRRDRVFLKYRRYADGSDDLFMEYVTGQPVQRNAMPPTTTHNGSILDNLSAVDIPLFEVSLSGLTVTKVTTLLPRKALYLPGSPCAQCTTLIQSVVDAVADARYATAKATEAYRTLQIERQEIRALLDAWETKVDRIDEYEQQLSDFASVLANNMDTFLLLGHSLIIPKTWVDYDPQTHSAVIQYSDYNATDHAVTLTRAPTVAGSIQTNAANIDYLLMMNGEE